MKCITCKTREAIPGKNGERLDRYCSKICRDIYLLSGPRASEESMMLRANREHNKRKKR